MRGCKVLYVRCFYAKFKFKNVRVNVVRNAECEYELYGKECTFWFILIVFADLNGKVGCIPEAYVIGKFGVKDVNDNSRRMLDMFKNTDMCRGCSYFKHKYVQNYT